MRQEHIINLLLFHRFLVSIWRKYNFGLIYNSLATLPVRGLDGNGFELTSGFRLTPT